MNKFFLLSLLVVALCSLLLQIHAAPIDETGASILQSKGNLEESTNLQLSDETEKKKEDKGEDLPSIVEGQGSDLTTEQQDEKSTFLQGEGEHQDMQVDEKPLKQDIENEIQNPDAIFDKVETDYENSKTTSKPHSLHVSENVKENSADSILNDDAGHSSLLSGHGNNGNSDDADVSYEEDAEEDEDSEETPLDSWGIQRENFEAISKRIDETAKQIAQNKAAFEERWKKFEEEMVQWKKEHEQEWQQKE